MNDRDFWLWLWVERASWVVAVVGLPMGVYQLFAVRKEQARLREDLTRRPDIVVGFLADNAVVSEMFFPMRWEPGQELRPPPVNLTFHVKNRGERSGHHVLINYCFPNVLDCPDVGHVAPPGGSLWKEPDGTIRMTRETDVLHPSVVRTDSIRLRLPKNVPEFEVKCAVSLDDSPPREFRLTVHVKGVA